MPQTSATGVNGRSGGRTGDRWGRRSGHGEQAVGRRFLRAGRIFPIALIFADPYRSGAPCLTRDHTRTSAHVGIIAGRARA
jgi:hypothetical protein